MRRAVAYTLAVLFLVAVAGGMALFLSRREDYTAVPIPLPLPTPEVIKTAFSLENAPRESLKGQIATMAGEVKWQSRVATEAALLTSPIPIQQGEELESGKKSRVSIVFPKVCRIDLSAETTIGFIQTLPTNLVFLQKKGEARYTKTGDSPLAIRAEHLLVQDGGELAISINPINGFVTVKVASGSAVAAYNDLGFNSHEVTIAAGQTYYFNDDKRRGVRE